MLFFKHFNNFFQEEILTAKRLNLTSSITSIVILPVYLKLWSYKHRQTEMGEPFSLVCVLIYVNSFCSFSHSFIHLHAIGLLFASASVPFTHTHTRISADNYIILKISFQFLTIMISFILYYKLILTTANKIGFPFQECVYRLHVRHIIAFQISIHLISELFSTCKLYQRISTQTHAHTHKRTTHLQLTQICVVINNRLIEFQRIKCLRLVHLFWNYFSFATPKFSTKLFT